MLEIEGLGHLKCEQAFELSDASAERSAAGCTIKLDPEPVCEYLRSNIVMLKWMVAEGYGDKRTLERRVARMEGFLEKPELMTADKEAEFPAAPKSSLGDAPFLRARPRPAARGAAAIPPPRTRPAFRRRGPLAAVFRPAPRTT